MRRGAAIRNIGEVITFALPVALAQAVAMTVDARWIGVVWWVAAVLLALRALLHPAIARRLLSWARRNEVLSTALACVVCAALGGLGWRALLRANHSDDDDRAMLKGRVSTLSMEVLRFARERQESDPNIMPRHETWERDVEAIIRYSQQTTALYSERYAPRVISAREALGAAGLHDKELDSFYEHPTNMIGIRIVGERLGALAERL